MPRTPCASSVLLWHRRRLGGHLKVLAAAQSHSQDELTLTCKASLRGTTPKKRGRTQRNWDHLRPWSEIAAAEEDDQTQSSEVGSTHFTRSQVSVQQSQVSLQQERDDYDDLCSLLSTTSMPMSMLSMKSLPSSETTSLCSSLEQLKKHGEYHDEAKTMQRSILLKELRSQAKHVCSEANELSRELERRRRCKSLSSLAQATEPTDEALRSARLDLWSSSADGGLGVAQGLSGLVTDEDVSPKELLQRRLHLHMGSSQVSARPGAPSKVIEEEDWEDFKISLSPLNAQAPPADAAASQAVRPAYARKAQDQFHSTTVRIACCVVTFAATVVVPFFFKWCTLPGVADLTKPCHVERASFGDC